MEDLPPVVRLTPTPPNAAGSPDVPDFSSAPNLIDSLKKFLHWLAKIKWTKVTIYFLSLGAFLAIVVSHPAFKNFINYIIPNASPLIGREVSLQGILKTAGNGQYFLVLPDNSTYTLHLKPLSSLNHLKNIKEAVVKGNLTWTAYVIENAEIYPLSITASEVAVSNIQTSLIPQTLSNPPSSSNPSSLPALYSGLSWETTQKRLLIFTSGKRKIEEEGVYLESAQVSSFPQEFINYYIENLKAANFKEILNSVSPEGITITYAKDDLFLTFGVKNIYSGAGNSKNGNSKKLAGYQAFIEHN